MTSPTATALGEPGFWPELVERYATRLAARPQKVRAYRELVDLGVPEAATRDYASLTLEMARPARRLINRSGGRKKTVYLFPPREDLFLKGVNHTVQRLTNLHSPLCHSFQPGRGVRTAYAALKQIPDLNRLGCLHVDVRDYFASIPPERMLAAVPHPLSDDDPFMALLREILRDPSGERRGVLAGSPLAPLLSNLYLRPLDDAFEAAGTPYLRYADDLVVFGDRGAIPALQAQITERLGDLALELNPRKTRVSPPGGAWEFLGLRYEKGSLDLSSTTVAKMHHRVRRLARRARGLQDPARYVVRRLNRKLYGAGGDASDFTWATWFFPLIGSDSTLRRLDRVIQEQLRFAATGRHERRNRGVLPYAGLVERGYLPLASAFRAFRRAPGEYEALVERRLGA
jgi:RNA-directed DNA polymerase